MFQGTTFVSFPVEWWDQRAALNSHLQMLRVWEYRTQAVSVMRPCYYIHCHFRPVDPLPFLKHAERASYPTRSGAEGDLRHGCMANTRVQAIANLEAWAWDDTAPKVYWLNGHLGTGKTCIAYTFSARNRLLLLSLGVKGCNPDHPYYYQYACSIKPLNYDQQSANSFSAVHLSS